MDISIIITNWNAKEVLAETLPTILKAAERDSNNNYEIVLIDDFSTDGSCEFVRKNFEGIKVYRTKKNMGYIRASNYGIKKSKNPFVFFINSDMKVKEDCFFIMASAIKDDENIFAVTPSVYDWNGKFLYGNRGGIFKKGHLFLYEKEENDIVSQTFFACGGLFLFRRDIYDILGGYDDLYHPFYYEEIDLSYRALKRGYKILYIPEAKAYHKIRSSISKSAYFDKIKYISGRNNYLFIWKNITDRDFVLQMLIYQPLFLIRDLFRLKFRFWVCFFWALVYIHKVIPKRISEKRYFILKDREIFDRVNLSNGTIKR